MEKFTLIPQSQYKDLMKFSPHHVGGASQMDNSFPPSVNEGMEKSSSSFSSSTPPNPPPPGEPAQAVEDPPADGIPRWIDVWQAI